MNRTDAANYVVTHQHKLPKAKIAFYTALYGLAAIQAWDVLAWIF